jgi:hypothetical protein
MLLGPLAIAPAAVKFAETEVAVSDPRPKSGKDIDRQRSPVCIGLTGPMRNRQFLQPLRGVCPMPADAFATPSPGFRPRRRLAPGRSAWRTTRRGRRLPHALASSGQPHVPPPGASSAARSPCSGTQSSAPVFCGTTRMLPPLRWASVMRVRVATPCSRALRPRGKRVVIPDAVWLANQFGRVYV